jgi:hypothetical protein
VAKYATKAAECTGTLDRRITPADQLAELPVSEHARRLIAECLRLSKLSGLEDLRLAAWAHMLGFRGHFSNQEPPPLHYFRRASCRTRPAPARPRLHRKSLARTRRRHHTGPRPLAIRRAGSPAHDPAVRRRHQIWCPTARTAGGRPAVTRLLLTVPRGGRGAGYLPQQAAVRFLPSRRLHRSPPRRAAQPAISRRRPRREEDHHQRIDRRGRGRADQRNDQERTGRGSSPSMTALRPSSASTRRARPPSRPWRATTGAVPATATSSLPGGASPSTPTPPPR